MFYQTLLFTSRSGTELLHCPQTEDFRGIRRHRASSSPAGISNGRSILDQFLAVLMTILLLPVGALVSGNRRDFQAGAQTGIVSCNGAGSTAIIKKPCGDGSTSPQEIIAFEADTVNAWLAAHELPLDDMVYQYGRTNLRNELRAYLLASIVAIIQKPAADRTPRERAVYQWMQANVKKLDVQLYQAAIAEWNTYKNDQCNYILDADIASNYGIQYDGTPFCYVPVESQ